MVRLLGQKESLELFSYHAFRKDMPPKSLSQLSVSIIAYTGGLPLALKVLGSSLFGKTSEHWKAILERLERGPEYDTREVKKLIDGELGDETVIAIFLNIVLFFIGKDKDQAVHIFRSCNFFPEIGIPILVERCLLTIDSNNKFQMHSFTQEIGRELAKSRQHLLLQNLQEVYVSHPEKLVEIEGLETVL
ncbi:hypothetical protein DCAR_0728650 [Daucus carota subsp. sativus]|uniref:Disease resistance protein Roq1-like winged-helix domain-containing protein n=1 Tax=Daucus carota subsp. sativus TaxID=79200 RepID=A0AAF0XJD5_DAUCS|nr:PREDICTED: TMV resistance protein N-like [Daucus carota subsp. sativus]WOH09195.1 hypothetical protein DCAR_0728650 [Daucus carota subsp. sativus]